MDWNAILPLFGFFLACFAAASTGGIFRPGAWYASLRKPSWRPPDWLFGPVWAVLYVMIAVSGWLVWRDAGWPAAALPLGLYAVQLVLNGLWSAIFFGFRRLGLALAEMALLWLAIVATMTAFHPINATAAWLLAPYLLWVSFAFVLNHAVWRLNRSTAAQLSHP